MCLGIAVISLLTFVELGQVVWQQTSFAWDAPIAIAIHQYHQPWFDIVMQVITEMGSSGAIVIALVGAGWLLWRHKYATAVALLLSWLGATYLNSRLKLFFRRLHPHLFPPLLIKTGYSFPSGHTSAAFAVYSFLAILLWRYRQYIWAILASFLVVAVAISRVYLGAHFPSDVVGSMTLGVVWLFVVFLVHDAYDRNFLGIQHRIETYTTAWATIKT